MTIHDETEAAVVERQLVSIGNFNDVDAEGLQAIAGNLEVRSVTFRSARFSAEPGLLQQIFEPLAPTRIDLQDTGTSGQCPHETGGVVPWSAAQQESALFYVGKVPALELLLIFKAEPVYDLFVACFAVGDRREHTLHLAG
jgi:hypothetical protein